MARRRGRCGPGGNRPGCGTDGSHLAEEAQARLRLGVGKSKEERQFKIVQGSPSMVWPEIAHARFRIWMIAFARDLMNATIEFWYDQFLATPPRDGAPTY